MKNFAFQTHVKCYTQESASVCRLPISDLGKIFSIIDLEDLVSFDGLSQIIGILNICIKQRFEDLGVAFENK
jgi:hypothetical protein